MIPLTKATANQYVPIRLLQDTDTDAGLTGVTSPTIQIAKAGGSLASPSDGTWTEVGDGAYWVRLDASDTDTEGPLLVIVTASGAIESVTAVWVREKTEKQVYDLANSGFGSTSQHTPAQVVTALLAHTFEVDGFTVETVLKTLLASARGRIVKSGANFTFYDEDGVTALFTLSASDTERTEV